MTYILVSIFSKNSSKKPFKFSMKEVVSNQHLLTTKGFFLQVKNVIGFTTMTFWEEISRKIEAIIMLQSKSSYGWKDYFIDS